MYKLSNTKIKRIIFYWLPFIFYSLLIIYLSHQPHLDLGPSAPSDKVLHFLEFFGYALLLLRVLALYKIKHRKIITIVASTIYGISDELHQFFIPGRDCSLSDVLIDILGAVSLVITCRLAKRFFSARFPQFFS